jgi:hypothetical protein
MPYVNPLHSVAFVKSLLFPNNILPKLCGLGFLVQGSNVKYVALACISAGHCILETLFDKIRKVEGYDDPPTRPRRILQLKAKV